MKKRTYFALVQKRALKLYPQIMLVAILLVSALVLSCAMLVNRDNSSEEKQKVRVGIVGNSTDTYLGIGVDILTEIDVSRFSIDFIRIDEESARKEVVSGKMAGYVKIPDDFISSVVYGDNIPVLYVTSNSPTGFGSIMMEEIGSIISDMIMGAQDAILGMQDVAKNTGYDGDLYERTEELNIEYIDNILNRSKAYSIEYVGISDKLSLGAYLFCGILMLLLLLWGIVCNRLLSKNDRSFDMLLHSKGQTVFSQVISEIICYFFVMFVTFLIFATITGSVFQFVSVGINELDKAHLSDYISYIFKIIPVLLMVSALHVLFYDLISGDVGVILFQFIFALGTGYISGCLYPAYFFPLTVQRIAGVLPTGVGVSYLRQTLSHDVSPRSLFSVVIYTVVFIGLATLMRRYRLAGKRQ